MEAFVRNPYELAEHCEFGTQRDEQMRDRIVIGILDKSLSKASDEFGSQSRHCYTNGALVRASRMASIWEKVHQKKGKPSPARRPARNDRNVRGKNTRNVPTVQPCSRIACTNKMKPAQRAGGGVLNVTRRAILQSFAVL